MFTINTILHPTDFSDCSRYAFRLASSLARMHGARLAIVHVSSTFGSMVAYGTTLAHLEPREYKEKLWEVLHRFQVSDPKIQVDYRIVEGEPAEEILKLAGQLDCDLIVMGTHGWSGLNHLLLGSVAEQVLRKAPCPVLTAKVPHRHPAKGAAEPLKHQEPAAAW